MSLRDYLLRHRVPSDVALKLFISTMAGMVLVMLGQAIPDDIAFYLGVIMIAFPVFAVVLWLIP